MSAAPVARDRALLAISQGRVRYVRALNGPTAPDFYRHYWTVDGVQVAPSLRLVLEALHQSGAIKAETFAGTIGPTTVAVTLAPNHVGEA